MSDKRFTKECGNNGMTCRIWDNGLPMTTDEVVDTLNEQQATISKQLSQIIELQDKYRILEFNDRRLEKRNKMQYEKIGEQQATIQSLEEEIKLLKPTNIEQYEQIQKLQEENEQLRKELNDCEKFRYAVFKRMGELQAKLREKEEDEQLYANEIVKLNKEAKEVLDFKSLGGNY